MVNQSLLTFYMPMNL